MTTPLDKFPEELLTKPHMERIDFFRNKFITHPFLATIREESLDAINNPGGASIISIFGPTGVGKTTLCLTVQKKLIEEAKVELENNRGYMPVIKLQAVASGTPAFDWKDFYKRILAAAEEPLIDFKIDYRTHGSRVMSNNRLIYDKSVNIADLRRATEQCLYNRRPKVVIVDDAQHIKKMPSGRRLLDQMDTIKTLADITSPTIWILVGNYELPSLTNLSAQLSRRTISIHFSRYHFDDENQMKIFKTILNTFQNFIPMEETPDLVKNYTYFYENCAGCVGILKNWLERAFAKALKEDAKTLTEKHWETCKMNIHDLINVARELREGEEKLNLPRDQEKVLSTLLGVTQPNKKNEEIKEKTNQVKEENKPHLSTSKKNQRSRVNKRQKPRIGERSPIRDASGR